MNTETMMGMVNSLETFRLDDDEGGACAVVRLSDVRRLAHLIEEPAYGTHGKIVYKFGEYGIGADMMGGLKRYICDGIPPGDFLTAIICNDLQGAVGRADGENMRNIPAFVSFFYNETPAGCWGSQERMGAWLHAIKTMKPTDGLALELKRRREEWSW